VENLLGECFAARIKLKTSEISDTHLKGKHTTTFAQMHFWDFGGNVIDTPGFVNLP
jgi:putative ribosome biogenesis GTPase RsgA